MKKATIAAITALTMFTGTAAFAERVCIITGSGVVMCGEKL